MHQVRDASASAEPPPKQRRREISAGSRLPPPPEPGSAVRGRVHRRDLMVGPGFEVVAVITIWVKVRAALSDTLHHAVGEMPGRAEGESWPHEFRVQALPGGHAGVPQNGPLRRRHPPARRKLLVSPQQAGGTGRGPLLLHKPWVEPQGEVSSAARLSGKEPNAPGGDRGARTDKGTGVGAAVHGWS